MNRLLIFLFPAIMDIVVGSVLFVCTVRVAESGASASAVTNILIIFSVGYVITTLLVGRIVTAGNSSWLLIGSSLAFALVSTAFIALPSIAAMPPLVAMIAVSAGFFFVSFQIFMKAVAHGQSTGIARSTALYTVSWSAGIALGPFISGYLWTHMGWKWCYIMNAFISIMTAFGIHIFRHYAKLHSGKDDKIPEIPSIDHVYAKMPDLAWVGWVASGIGILAISIIRGIFPSTAFSLEIPKTQQGTVFAILYMTQAVVALGFIRSRTWMFRILPPLLFGICGVTGLLIFGLAHNIIAFYIAAVCFGIYSSAFFFYLVFHSLIHPTRAPRYISINEAIVGLGNIIGCGIGGYLADRFGLSTPYFAAAGFVMIAIGLTLAVHRFYASTVKEHLKTGRPIPACGR